MEHTHVQKPRLEGMRLPLRTGSLYHRILCSVTASVCRLQTGQAPGKEAPGGSATPPAPGLLPPAFTPHAVPPTASPAVITLDGASVPRPAVPCSSSKTPNWSLRTAVSTNQLSWTSPGRLANLSNREGSVSGRMGNSQLHPVLGTRADTCYRQRREVWGGTGYGHGVAMAHAYYITTSVYFVCYGSMYVTNQSAHLYSTAGVGNRAPDQAAGPVMITHLWQPRQSGHTHAVSLHVAEDLPASLNALV